MQKHGLSVFSRSVLKFCFSFLLQFLLSSFLVPSLLYPLPLPPLRESVFGVGCKSWDLCSFPIVSPVRYLLFFVFFSLFAFFLPPTVTLLHPAPAPSLNPLKLLAHYFGGASYLDFVSDVLLSFYKIPLKSAPAFVDKLEIGLGSTL